MIAPRRQIDWQELHRQLGERLGCLSASFEANMERSQALLRERTRQLAARPGGEQAQGKTIRTLIFSTCGEKFGLPLVLASAVIPMPHVARVPEAGAGMLGIIGWRGEFAVLFDTAALFALPAIEAPLSRRVIVLQGTKPRIGLVADHVEQICTVGMDTLQPPDRLRPGHTDLFCGMNDDGVFMIEDKGLAAQLQKALTKE